MAKIGAPSKYRPEFVEQARKLCRLGATLRDLGEFFDVSERTINTWISQHEEFQQAVKVGAAAADARVEQSLYRRATGYSFDAVKVFKNKGEEPTIVPYVENVPPDTTACIFWLKNRKPEDWRDVKAVEHDIGKRLANLTDEALEARVAELIRKAGTGDTADRTGATH